MYIFSHLRRYLLGNIGAIRFTLLLHALSILALGAARTEVSVYIATALFSAGACCLPMLLGFLTDEVRWNYYSNNRYFVKLLTFVCISVPYHTSFLPLSYFLNTIPTLYLSTFLFIQSIRSCCHQRSSSFYFHLNSLLYSTLSHPTISSIFFLICLSLLSLSASLSVYVSLSFCFSLYSFSSLYFCFSLF